MNPVANPNAFDLTGPLPGPGIHVLEASAGTGKTFTIAALTARYLAEGVPLSKLLMVTFSRAATQELRDRIRQRLTESEAALRGVLDGSVVPNDPVDRLLGSGSVDQVRLRLQRIAGALADFDAATIATTHEFCGRMLDGLGTLGGVDTSATHVDNVIDLSREVAADFWLRAFAGADRAEFDWKAAQEIAAEVAEFDGPLAPDPERLPSYARQLSFAEAVRREVTRRKASRGLITYNDLLTRLRDLLEGRTSPEAPEDPDLATTARRRLRDRFRVVLVDEFQDTDPVQWQVLSRAFAEESALVLIGDPKQAIYAFRGADVNAYLSAVTTEGVTVHSLDTNYRTDAGLVEALGGLLTGTELGDPRIVARPVRAHHRQSRLHSADGTPATPLRLRVLPPSTGRRSATASELTDAIVSDLVADIGHRLNDGTTVTLDDGNRPVGPRDLAILVRENWFAERIRSELSAAGIPAVFAGATSVYNTAEATDWLTLLRACATPRSDSIREVALTCFHGWSLPELIGADEAALSHLSTTVRAWARTLAHQGVAALTEAVIGSGATERLLAQPGGDRRLTDLRHIGQALHAAQVRGRLGPAALVDWLTDQCAASSADPEDRTRRLETDADAVQVMTVWRSKGLEFPIVYLPDLWQHTLRRDKGRPFAFHHEGRRHLYLAPRCQDRYQAYTIHQNESAAESLRLFYVAATRAQCQLVAWWAAHDKDTGSSPLHRLLFRAGAAQPKWAYPIDTSPADLLQPPGMVIETVGQIAAAIGDPLVESLPELRERRFVRALDVEWRRTSYSGLTARAHDVGPAAPVPIEGREDDELTRLVDEGDVAEAHESEPLTGDLAIASPMAGLPRGAVFGTLVHAIYETFDPHADDLHAEVAGHTAHWLNRLPAGGGADVLSTETLTEALLPALRTPLGPIADNLRLRDIPATDRLAELDFEYPLAGGDRPTGRILLAGIADLLDAHLDPDDVLTGYAEQLRDPVLAEEVLRGYLIGSIDAVLRVPGEASSRYLVVDYKTNWLGPPEDPLLLGHYTRSAMATAMMAAHYPLQALLYCVALHRFLRWRVRDYDPDRDLGGVAYLFVRGMAGESTPLSDGHPCGVFSWRPPARLVLALSDLLAGPGEAS